MKAESLKIENPTLFVFVFIAFVLSVFLIIFGVWKIGSHKGQKDELPQTKNGQEVVNEDGKSISDYFQNTQVNISDNNPDHYYQEDPFKEKCAAVGNKKPSVVSGTVCYY